MESEIDEMNNILASMRSTLEEISSAISPEGSTSDGTRVIQAKEIVDEMQSVVSKLPEK